MAGRGSMRSSAWLRAALLASSVHATLVAHEDGSVTAIQSMARKHFGRRSVELDVTGARLVIIAQEDDVATSAADYAGAVVLINPRPGCAITMRKCSVAPRVGVRACRAAPAQ